MSMKNEYNACETVRLERFLKVLVIDYYTGYCHKTVNAKLIITIINYYTKTALGASYGTRYSYKPRLNNK